MPFNTACTRRSRAINFPFSLEPCNMYFQLLVERRSVFAQPVLPDCPVASGAYHLQGTTWLAMDPSHSTGFKTTNVAGAAFSYGAAKARVKAQFREARSPYQLPDSSFAMCLVGTVDTGRDITLARFQEEKDRRELSMASYRMWTGINAQMDPKVLIPITVEKKGEKIYLVTSKEPSPLGNSFFLR
jgi:hypothetical protein